MKSYRIDNNQRAILSEDMKLIELIDADYRLLSVLLRLDIELPYGDISVEQMCRRYAMSTPMFLDICRIYSFSDSEIDLSELSMGDMPTLLKFLRSSHRYYLQTLMPRIAQGIAAVLEYCEPRQKSLLSKFYGDYASEVEEHLLYEETQMFPYVDTLCRGGRGEQMDEYLANHTDICEKIDDIKSIIIKYLPEACPTHQRCDLLFDIFAMREDLYKHTLLENNILAPIVVAEQRG